MFRINETKCDDSIMVSTRSRTCVNNKCVVTLTGPPGPTGPTGPTGPIGPTGTVLPNGIYESDYLYWHAGGTGPFGWTNESGGTGGNVHLGSFALQNNLQNGRAANASNTAIGTSTLTNNT